MHPQFHHLIQLLEDPNEEIFAIVGEQIIQMGSEVLPHINQLYETSIDPLFIQRLDHLSAKLEANETGHFLTDWLKNDKPSYLEFLLELHPICTLNNSLDTVEAFVQSIRKKIWLECNQYLTTLEQVNVLTQIINHQLQIRDITNNNNPPTYHHLFPASLIQSQFGHNFLLACLYKGLTQLFEINMQLITVDNNKIMCAFTQNDNKMDQILCVVDPGCGSVYTMQDLEEYSIQQLNHKGFISKYFQEILHLANNYKQDFLVMYAQHVYHNLYEGK